MKARIVVAVFVTLVAIGAFRSTPRAEQPVPSQQTPPTAAAGKSLSVWDGVYTEGQAARGGQLYTQKCAHCHAADLTGSETAPSLISPDFRTTWNGLSVDDLFERIQMTMPQDDPGVLTRQQTADILAFVFSKGGFPVGKTELAQEAEVLKGIRFEATKPKP
jgi:mono/diheme cytochrome c family protein